MSDEQVKFDVLKRFIQGRTPTTFMYQGMIRKACPHLLGITKDNRMVCHGYQFGGGSSKGEVTPETGGWRFFYLDEISEISFGDPAVWYPGDLKKSEVEYKPPAFIIQILVVAPRD